jgi:uncharacterized protein
MGRGRHYGLLRRWADAVQRPLYGSGRVARAAYSVGLQGRLNVDRQAFTFAEGRAPLSVAFVSDLHAGPLTDPRLLETVAHQVAEAAPDILLLGGDYVSLHHSDVGGLATLLACLRPRLGIFGVLGNHDLWQDDVAISKALTDMGVRLLINEEQRLPEPYSHVVVYGMDDPGTGYPQGPARSIGSGDLRIVLMHSPLGLRHLESGSFHVAFCGHTHGGQIAMPSGAPIVLPRGSGDRGHARGGVFQVDGGKLLVSRGLGMSDLPIRVFAPSEIHLCSIQ